MNGFNFIKKSSTISTKHIIANHCESSTNPLLMLNDSDLVSEGYTSNTYAIKPDSWCEEKMKELRIEELNKKIVLRLEKAEKLKKIRICNRIAFIKSEKEKQNKSIEVNRNKLEQLTEIKTKDKNEKEIMGKTRTFNDLLDNTHKQKLINEVKENKKKRKQSLDIWKSVIQENAEKVRRQTLNNETYSHFYKLKEQQNKYKNARKVKFSLEKSRKAISERNNSKIENTKKCEKLKLAPRLRTLSEQKKEVKHLEELLSTEIMSIRKGDGTIETPELNKGHQIMARNQTSYSVNPEKSIEFRSKSVCLSL